MLNNPLVNSINQNQEKFHLENVPVAFSLVNILEIKQVFRKECKENAVRFISHLEGGRNIFLH